MFENTPPKKRFLYIHCFDILKNEPKWKQNDQNRRDKRSAPMPPRGAAVVDVDEENDLSPQVERRRPMGVRAAKVARSNSLSSASSESFIKAMKENSEASIAQREKQISLDESHRQRALSFDREVAENMTAIEREKLQLLKLEHDNKLAIEREKLDLQRQEQELMIFRTDLNGLDPDVQEYYRSLRKQILRRRRQVSDED